MSISYESFLYSMGARSSLVENKKAKAVYDWLEEPVNVIKMRTLADLGIAPLNSIVKELEDKLGESGEFNAKEVSTRQDIGKMITYILNKYGYSATESKEYLRFFSGAKYFKQGRIYKQTRRSSMSTVVKSKKLDVEDRVKLFRENKDSSNFQAYRIKFGGDLIDIGMRVKSIEPVSAGAIDEDMLEEGNIYLYTDDGTKKYTNQIATWLEIAWVTDEEADEDENISTIAVLDTVDGQLPEWALKALEESNLLLTPILGW